MESYGSFNVCNWMIGCPDKMAQLHFVIMIMLDVTEIFPDYKF